MIIYLQKVLEEFEAKNMKDKDGDLSFLEMLDED